MRHQTLSTVPVPDAPHNEFKQLHARRQIVLTDIYCQIAEQIGHVAAMSLAVTTPSFGICVPDVVWMPPDKWDGFDREAPVPFVPDLCVEVLLDRKMPQDIGPRVKGLPGGRHP
ncbi:hypothetical protein AB4Y32_20800 [Paraburkholderia phymatum]|uniref:Uncharacterized protein n=1 Tax=Paraburkholderia phymatum TaxID=148447 RepID=A0ACC6U3J7_9BURK